MEEQQSLDDTTNQSNAPAGRRDSAELASRARQMQELALQRERVLSERTANPVRRAALQAALADIESRIARLS